MIHSKLVNAKVEIECQAASQKGGYSGKALWTLHGDEGTETGTLAWPDEIFQTEQEAKTFARDQAKMWLVVNKGVRLG